MKLAASLASVVVVAAIAGSTTFMLNSAPQQQKNLSTSVDDPARDPKMVAALDNLATQLQRRFHDRNNVSFGMERVVRVGARLHNDVVMGTRDSYMTNEDGKQYEHRQSGNGIEYKIADDKWVPWQKIKPMMHAENDDESAAIRYLRGSGKEVVIYTAGQFTAENEPKRVKGPAYLRQDVPEAPRANLLTAIASQAWKNKASEVSKDGWTYFVHRVKIDDASCLRCHGMDQHGTQTGLKVGEDAGLFMIAIKDK